MSALDLSLKSVPPEGGTDALESGTLGAKDETPSDAFAQLLAHLSNGPEDAVSSAATPGETAEAVERAADRPSPSPDGWEETGATSADKSSDDEDEAFAVPVTLTAFLMPEPIPERVNGQRGEHVDEAHETLSSVASSPGARAGSVRSTVATETLQSVFAQKIEKGVPGSPEGPLGGEDAAQFDTLPIGIDETAVEAAIAGAGSLPRATRGNDRAFPVENADAPTDPPTDAPGAMSVQALAASLERRAGAQGESQPDLSSRNLPATSGSAGQPQQITHAFQQAMAAAMPALDVSAPSAGAAPEQGGLDNQIVQGIRRLWRDGGEEIRVTLRPEYLGALTIALRVDQNAVRAVLHVDEPQVRAWVQAHEAQLRQAMSSQGLSLEQLVITDERPGREPQGREAETRQRRRPNQHRTGADSTPVFEVAA